MTEYSYENYNDDDQKDCLELSDKAWPEFRRFSDNNSSAILPYFLANLYSSNYKEVCRDGDKVIGFLFAHIKNCAKDKTLNKQYRTLLFDYIKGTYGKISKKFSFLFTNLLAVFQTEYMCRHFDAEVLLFVVDEAYRGKGIGKALISHFENSEKADKSKTIYLVTDPLCNWKFYEKAGFSLYRTFKDKALSLLMNKKAESIIYYKNL